MAQDKGWASSVESKEDPGVAKVRQQLHTWALRLELDGVAISWNSTIREFQNGHAQYLPETLEQPLFLPKDTTALRHMRQLNLFMSLKRDLALVSFPTCLTEGVFSFSLLFYFLFLTYSLVVYM